jgi:hypothetical protein
MHSDSAKPLLLAALLAALAAPCYGASSRRAGAQGLQSFGIGAVERLRRNELKTWPIETMSLTIPLFPFILCAEASVQ